MEQEQARLTAVIPGQRRRIGLHRICRMNQSFTATDLTLPTDINAVTKQNFVYRMLFRDIY